MVTDRNRFYPLQFTFIKEVIEMKKLFTLVISVFLITLFMLPVVGGVTSSMDEDGTKTLVVKPNSCDLDGVACYELFTVEGKKVVVVVDPIHVSG